MRENFNHATKEIINDVERVEYLRDYLDSLATAIRCLHTQLCLENMHTKLTSTFFVNLNINE